MSMRVRKSIFLIMPLFLIGCGAHDQTRDDSELNTIYYKDNDFFEWNGSDTYIADVISQVSADGVEYYCAYYGVRNNEQLFEKQSKVELLVDKWSIYAHGDQRWHSQPLDPRTFHGPDVKLSDGFAWSKVGSYVVPTIVSIPSGLAAPVAGFFGGWGAGAKLAGAQTPPPIEGGFFSRWGTYISSKTRGAVGALKDPLNTVVGVGKGGMYRGLGMAGGTIAGLGVGAALLTIGTYTGYKSLATFITTIDRVSYGSQLRTPSALQEVDSWGAFKHTINMLKKAKPMHVNGSCPAPELVLAKVRTHRDFAMFESNLSPAKSFTFESPSGGRIQIVQEKSGDESLILFREEGERLIRGFRRGNLEKLKKVVADGIAKDEGALVNIKKLVPNLNGFWDPSNPSTTLTADKYTVEAMPALFDSIMLYVENHF